MSNDKFVFAPNEVFQDGRLSKMQLRVLLGILSFRDRKTTAPIHPKRKTLAARVGYSEKVISRTTTQLVNLGWLTKIGKGGFSKPSEYQFHVPDSLLNTVTESVRVTEPVTVTDSVPNGYRTSTTTVTESVRGKQQTITTDHNKHIYDLFEQFWIAYPKKRSKGQAEKAFLKLKPSEQLMEQILSALERAKTSNDWITDDGQYIPYPASWLNAKGWDDEYNEVNNETSRKHSAKSQSTNTGFWNQLADAIPKEFRSN